MTGNGDNAKRAAVAYLVARQRLERRPSLAHSEGLREAAAVAEQAGWNLFALDGLDAPSDVLRAAGDILRTERRECGCPACVVSRAINGGAA